METKILVPDYYPEFHCKCGDCRHSCCSGWGIAISMEEYFRLLGQPCSPELRQKLDTAMSVLPDSTEERYALLNPDWTGHCMLQRRDNGYCMLQCECGEEAIPEVCRRYPRGLRTAFQTECACACSCERTLELLLASGEPLRFTEIGADGPLRETQPHEEKESAVRDRGIRDRCLRILEDRTLPLGERILRMAKSADGESGAQAAEDDAGVQAPEDRNADPQQAPEDRNADPQQASKDMNAGAQEAPEAKSDRSAPLVTVLFLLKELAMDSRALGDEVAEAFEKLGVDPDKQFKDTLELDHAEEGSLGTELKEAEDRFGELLHEFEKGCPDWEIRFEKMLSNHLFFDGFPYSARSESVSSECMAMAAAYLVLVFMNAVLFAGRGEEERFIDLNASLFRFLEHGNFTWNAPLILKTCGYECTGDLSELLRFS